MQTSRFGGRARRESRRLRAIGLACGPVAAFVFVVAGLSACKGEFTGPYPCEVNYASCVNPDRNRCETNITADAAHCGACGHACEVGALCVNSTCLQGALKLASLQSGNAPQLAVNAGGVYWGQSGQSEIMTVPLTGGTPAVAASNVVACGSNGGIPFALNDSALYYWSNNIPCPSGGCTTYGLAAQTLAGGTITPLIQNAQSISGGGCPSAMALDKTRVYWVGNDGGSTLVMSVALSGGVAATLATLNGGGSAGGIAVTPSLVLFAASQNGPTQLQSVPLTGTTGSPNTLSLQMNGQMSGLNAFVANDKFVFVATGGCPCDSNDNNGVLPTGRIDRFALDGSGGVNLAGFDGLIQGMALDSTNVYFATDTTVWKVPIGGGEAQRVAGNLLGGSEPYQCNNSCSTPMSTTLSIAVDTQSVFIADGAPSVNALLRVRK